MTEKLKSLRNLLEEAEEWKSELKIVRLQGVFGCLLIRKFFENGKLNLIEVKALENENPDYEKNEKLTIDLNDGGLIEIQFLN